MYQLCSPEQCGLLACHGGQVVRDEDTERKKLFIFYRSKGPWNPIGNNQCKQGGACPMLCCVCLLASFVRGENTSTKGLSVQYQSIKNYDHINNSLCLLVNGECFIRMSCVSSIMPDFSLFFLPEKKLSQFRALCMVMYISQSSKLPVETSLCRINTNESHINNHYVVIKTSWLMYRTVLAPAWYIHFFISTTEFSFPLLFSCTSLTCVVCSYF